MGKRKALNPKEREGNAEREVELDAVSGEKKSEKDDTTETAQENLSRPEGNRYTHSLVCRLSKLD